MRIRWMLAVILCGVLLSPVEAHEGEEHGGPEVAAVPMPGEGLLAESAFSETFEMVLKHPPISPRKEETLKIFLTDFATNAPVEKAAIEIEANGPAQIKAPVSETEIHGIYETKISFPQKGDYNLVFNIRADELTDTLIVNKISVGTSQVKGCWIGNALKTLKRLLFLALLFAAAAFAWRRRIFLMGLVRR